MATYNSFLQAQSIVRDLFASARAFHWTHAGLLDARERRLFSLPGYTGTRHQRFTRYEIGFLRGMWETLSEAMWREVVWAFNVAPQGQPDEPVLYREATVEQIAMIHAECNERGHHYWPARDGSCLSKDRFS